MKPVITISYCPKCGWLLRASYLAQEILTTFANEVHGVMLQPADQSGTLTVAVDDKLVFDRRVQGSFPDIKLLKQTIRDIVAPGKSLGHSDRAPQPSQQNQ